MAIQTRVSFLPAGRTQKQIQKRARKQAQKRRKTRPPEYYQELCQKLPSGPVRVEYAENTEINMNGVWKKWIRYCKYLGKDELHFIQNGSTQDFMTFFKWMLDTYRGIRKATALHEYFRSFKMQYNRHNSRWMPNEMVLSINDYLGLLYKKYGLDRSIPAKPVMSVDDLVLALHYHWVRDDSTFDDERQRVQLAFLLLLAAYTGQRPCSLLETRRSRGSLPSIKNIGSRDSTSEDEDSTSQEDEIDVCFNDSGENAINAPVAGNLPRGILYRHVKLRVLRSHSEGQRNPLVMEVTMVHTKGEDRNPQPKTFLFYENRNLLLCPIAHMLALAWHDNAFKESNMRQIDQLFHIKVPPQKNCVTLWWKAEMENKPILRQPTKTSEGRRTSEDMPLTYTASSRALSRLGKKAGFEHRLQHYAVRRGTGNAVDSVASVHELSQVMGHRDARTFEFYRNQRVKCDVQAAFLGQPSETTLIKELGQMSLTVNPNAPTELTADQKNELLNDPTICTLRKRRDQLALNLQTKATEEIRCDILKKKKHADARLQAAKVQKRSKLLERTRKEFFRNADTEDLNVQFGKNCPKAYHQESVWSPRYQTRERARIVRAFAEQQEDLGDELRLAVRINFVRNMTALCDKKEARCRPTDPKAAPADGEELLSPRILKRIDPRQCLFCLCDIRRSYERRMRKYSRPAKMMDHVENEHLRGCDPASQFPCPHPSCRHDDLILQGLSAFKNHVLRAHGIKLRDPSQSRLIK